MEEEVQNRNLSDKDIIEIIQKIMHGEGSDEELNSWFDNELSDLPEISNLIFYPEKQMTPEEILERCRQHKPIYL
jgi:hypothetical protein